jgi:hypothetical protein
MEASFAILAWDVLIIDEELMPCCSPVISPEGDVVHESYLSMLMIQPLLADVLAMGPAGWSRAHRELEERNRAYAQRWGNVKNLFGICDTRFGGRGPEA